MLAKQATGQGAAAKKYDMLTALATMACAGHGLSEKTALRFLLLVTARYNWARDELSVGRAEMARLWQVDERTVKRELAKLKAQSWLIVKRPPARGRVAVYGIAWSRVLEASVPVWSHVGPDFVARMAEMHAGSAAPPAPSSKVVAFPIEEGQGPWDRIRKLLHDDDPGFFTSWCAKLAVSEMSESHLILRAPSNFHARYLASHGMDRLFQAAIQIIPSLRAIEIDST